LPSYLESERSPGKVDRALATGWG